ncbi:phosphoribosyltransferase family protein [Synechococcus sp. W60.1]|uniref:phosphoribosyltransferase family protein n=1 Tax=Synechococcus sp. W60.1 TaxID=2964516 RepID=UPI0039C11FEB
MSEIEVFDAEQLAGLIEGLAEAIGRDHPHLQKLTLIGIRTRGVPLAYRLRDRIATLLGIPPQVGELDITFFRDDLSAGGLRTPDRSEMPRDLTGQEVVLVDDVIFRGRTVRAALEALNHFGRPDGAIGGVDRPGSPAVPHPARLLRLSAFHRTGANGESPSAGNRCRRAGTVDRQNSKD